MFCPNCGNKNEDNSLFCSNCGMKLGAGQQQSESFAGNINTVPNSNMGTNNNGMAYPGNAMPEMNGGMSYSGNNTMPNMNNNMSYSEGGIPTMNNGNGMGYPINNMEPNKKSKAVPIAISIIAVLIIIAGIIITVVLLNNNDNNKERETATTREKTTTEEKTTEEKTTEERTTEERTTEERTTGEKETGDLPSTLVGIDNISFILPGSFEKNDALDGNYVRYDDDGNPIESIYYYVQTESQYTEEEMREGYRINVEETYGEDYEFTTYYVGDLEFDHYSFETDTLLEGYYSEVYVYSDGTNTLYIEGLILEGEADSLQTILDTVSVTE